MGKFTVIDGGGSDGDGPSPMAALRAEHFAAQLRMMMDECLKANPTFAVLVWEGKAGEGVSELRTLVTPPSQAALRGVVELLYEQIHSGEM
jgi:hypothetical protein